MEKSIGDIIREARDAAGFTQNQLSQKTAIAQATLSHYERGNLVPGFAILKKIGNAVGCDLIVELRKRKVK